jgi:phosphoesterase RecJ-like protein
MARGTGPGNIPTATCRGGSETALAMIAAAVVASSGRFCLTTHIHPDGDAIGSTLALKALLEARGDDVVLWHAEGTPAGFEALGEHVWLTECPADIAERVAIVLDSATEERTACDLGELAQATIVLALDHHKSNSRFASINAVSPDAPATAVLVTALADILGVELTESIARPLYYGLWTDTGGLRYANATPEAHALHARLAAALGAEAYAALDAELTHIPASWQAYGDLGLAHAREIAPGLLFSALGPADAAACDLDPENQKQANDVALNLIQERPARLHVLWYELSDGYRSVSLRCQSKQTDCAALAAQFGGGGHAAAAGFTTSDSSDQVAAAITRALAA